MIDLHAHLLPGVDDGPATMDDALAMARATVAAGVGTVVATPHVAPAYPDNGPDLIGEAVSELRDGLDRAGIALDVVAGAELDLERAAALDDATLRRLRLGDGPFVMLECPLTVTAADPEALVSAISRRGHRVLLAHPERSPVLQRDPAQVQRLVALGALTSVTAGALGGRFGTPVQRMARQLFADGLVHNLVSDMHDLAGRPPGIRDSLGSALDDVAGLRESLDWLTSAVPAAILSGDRIPTGPALPPPSRRLLRLWR